MTEQTGASASAQKRRGAGVDGGSHAIVIGGSMAGLLAARALVNHVERVTIVERDHFPTGPVPRAGVPQARHVHILLMQGQYLLERMFPGLSRDLAAAGAPEIDVIGDFPVLSLGGWTCRFASGYIARTCSRALLEWSVRRRLAALGSVDFRDGCRVSGLVADPSRTRVVGVRVRPQGAGNTPGEEAEADEVLHADLVVDASGRSSRAPEWLDTLGYPTPAETVINSFLGYASRWYEPPAGFQADWKGVLVGAKAPDHPRGGVIFPVENGRWVVLLSGAGRDYPPTDPAAFMEFARSLRSPVLYEAIREASPLTPVYGYRRTENRLRHYERLSRWPEGFVVLGDAVCAFNPVYGQGMTVAALGAAALDRCLRERRTRQPAGPLGAVARPFQQTLARVNAAPWLMATGEDFRWPTTEGGQPHLATRLMHRYMDQVLILTGRSPAAYRTFMQVTHLLKPPRALFRPEIVAGVLGQLLAAPTRGRTYARAVGRSMPAYP